METSFNQGGWCSTSSFSIEYAILVDIKFIIKYLDG